MTKKLPQPNPHRPNFWEFLVHLINKGQFFGLLLAVIIIISLLKMTHEDVAKLYENALDKLENHDILGWISSAILVPASTYLYSRQKRVYESRLDAMGNKTIKD